METLDDSLRDDSSMESRTQQDTNFTPRVKIESLPNEALTNIMSFLGFKELVR